MVDKQLLELKEEKASFSIVSLRETEPLSLCREKAVLKVVT